MCKENLYAKMEKLEAQICTVGVTRDGHKVMPCHHRGVKGEKSWLSKASIYSYINKLEHNCGFLLKIIHYLIPSSYMI